MCKNINPNAIVEALNRVHAYTRTRVFQRASVRVCMELPPVVQLVSGIHEYIQECYINSCVFNKIEKYLDADVSRKFQEMLTALITQHGCF